MKEAEILEVVAQMLRETLLIEEPVALESEFRKDLQLDSMDSIDLVVQVENRFGIELDESSIGELQTVGQLVQHVAKQLRASAGRGID